MLGAYMGVTNCEMGLIWRIHVMIREPDTFGHVGIIRPIGIYPLVNVYSFANWKITIFKFGKSTISMAMFNSYVKLPQGNDHCCIWQVTFGLLSSPNQLLGSYTI
jgi:hypothetical protein